MTNITIGVNAPHTIPSRFLEHFVKMIFFTLNAGHKLNFAFDSNYVISWSKNLAIKTALENKSDYVFFLDVDVFVPEDIIAKLMARDKDIISGPYHFKLPPYFAQAYGERADGAMQMSKILEKKVYEVDGIGGGCLLIKTSIFDKIEYPYFKLVEANTAEADEGLVYPKDMNMTEDLYFSKKVRQAGFKIHYDNTINGVSHFGTPVDFGMHMKYITEFVQQMQKQQEQQEQKK